MFVVLVNTGWPGGTKAFFVERRCRRASALSVFLVPTVLLLLLAGCPHGVSAQGNSTVTGVSARNCTRGLQFFNATLGACVNLTQCVSGTQFQLFAGNFTADRICRNFTTCNFTAQFEARRPNATADRLCSNLTICNPRSQFERFPATRTSDRVCANSSSITPTTDRVALQFVFSFVTITEPPSCRPVRVPVTFETLFGNEADRSSNFVSQLAARLRAIGWSGNASDVTLFEGSVRARINYLVPSQRVGVSEVLPLVNGTLDAVTLSERDFSIPTTTTTATTTVTDTTTVVTAPDATEPGVETTEATELLGRRASGSVPPVRTCERTEQYETARASSSVQPVNLPNVPTRVDISLFYFTMEILNPPTCRIQSFPVFFAIYFSYPDILERFVDSLFNVLRGLGWTGTKADITVDGSLDDRIQVFLSHEVATAREASEQTNAVIFGNTNVPVPASRRNCRGQDVFISSTVTSTVQLPPSVFNITRRRPQLSKFQTLLDASRIEETLAKRRVETVTLFAVDNSGIPDTKVKYLLANPDQLQRFIAYHVVPDQSLAVFRFAALRWARTLEGNFLHLTETTVNNRAIFQEDLQAQNGFVHVLASLLVPPPAPTTTTRRTTTTTTRRTTTTTTRYRATTKSTTTVTPGRKSDVSSACPPVDTRPCDLASSRVYQIGWDGCYVRVCV
jgi:uncharacterized surface protein with fasciclin (FAS1) repeats